MEQPAPFPDIPAKMLGVLSTDDNDPSPTLMTDEPHVTWHDLAQVAAANSGIDVTPINTLIPQQEVITIDNDDDNAMTVLPEYPIKMEQDDQLDPTQDVPPFDGDVSGEATPTALPHSPPVDAPTTTIEPQ